MNKSYLPSKKIWVLIGSIIIIAVVFFIFSNRSSQDRPASTFTQSDGTEVQLRDSDNDGLEDWEESLWNTDPNNPDTDGDGVSDGDEVEQGTHPKIPGPNDAVDQRRISAIYNQDAKVRENLTREAWEDLLPYMASYISLSGEKEISANELDELSEEVARRAKEKGDEIDRRSREDLQVINDTTFDELDAYFTDFSATSNEYYANTEIDDELLLFAQATAEEDTKEEMLVGLEVIATDYRALASDLQNIAVPEELSRLHLEIINNYLAIAQAVENMSALEEDPMRAMVGVERYRELANINVEVTSALGTEIGDLTRTLLE